MEALSNKQFNTEKSMLSQGNEDELATRVRGIQNLTSNVFRPAFSSDYTKVHSMPSGTQFGENRQMSEGMAEGEEEE
jgi:hypothetical protein